MGTFERFLDTLLTAQFLQTENRIELGNSGFGGLSKIILRMKAETMKRMKAETTKRKKAKMTKRKKAKTTKRDVQVDAEQQYLRLKCRDFICE